MNKLEQYKQAQEDAARSRKRVEAELMQRSPPAFYLNPTQKSTVDGVGAFAEILPDGSIRVSAGALAPVQAHRLAEWILDLVRE